MDFTAYTTDNWQDRLEYIATKEGFNFTQDEDGDITLQKFSPYGQDFTIELVKPLDYRDALDDRNAVVALGKYVSDTEQKVANEIVDKIKKQYGYKELPLQSEAPRIVVPSSPVQEQAQAILNARGERNDNTLKNAQEERKSQSHKL